MILLYRVRAEAFWLVIIFLLIFMVGSDLYGGFRGFRIKVVLLHSLHFQLT